MEETLCTLRFILTTKQQVIYTMNIGIWIITQYHDCLLFLINVKMIFSFYGTQPTKRATQQGNKNRQVSVSFVLACYNLSHKIRMICPLQPNMPLYSCKYLYGRTMWVIALISWKVMKVFCARKAIGQGGDIVYSLCCYACMLCMDVLGTRIEITF